MGTRGLGPSFSMSDNMPNTLSNTYSPEDTPCTLQALEAERNRQTTDELYQSFDCIGKALNQPQPGMDFLIRNEGLRKRLNRLQGKVEYLEEQNRLLSSQLSSSQEDPYLLESESVPEELREGSTEEGKRRFSLCKWICGDGPKFDSLPRRHLSSKQIPITSPLFRLGHPIKTERLLEKYASPAEDLLGFIQKHKSLHGLEDYVTMDTSAAPFSPLSEPESIDETVCGLPPLASEEYRGHLTRISQFIRCLQAIDNADSVFLSDPRTHLLLDLIVDLEKTHSVPRINFLRHHAQTIKAMSMDPMQSSITESQASYAAQLPWFQMPYPMKPSVERMMVMPSSTLPKYMFGHSSDEAQESDTSSLRDHNDLHKYSDIDNGFDSGTQISLEYHMGDRIPRDHASLPNHLLNTTGGINFKLFPAENPLAMEVSSLIPNTRSNARYL